MRYELDRVPSTTPGVSGHIRTRADADGLRGRTAHARRYATAVRALVEDDLPAVVDLVTASFPHNRWRNKTACASYLRDVLLANPWRDDELPSWVSEDGSGLTGFCGVVPRRMSFRGRGIRVAVSTSFMVHPRARGDLSALLLAQKVLSGPQDLTLTDGATPEACRLWRGIGGTVPALYNLHWVQPLRPVRYALSVLGRRSRAARVVELGVGSLADLAAAAAPGPRGAEIAPGQRVERPLSASDVAAGISIMAGRAELHPIYEAASLDWLIERLGEDHDKGLLRARAVLQRTQVIGWFIYYASPGGVGEVVQFAANGSSHDLVWRRLLDDARSERTVALRGRLQPELIGPLAASRAWLRVEGPHLLTHSRHAAINEAIERGGAFLSRLDGEWWIRLATG